VRHEAHLAGLHHAEVVHGSPVQPVEFGDNDGVILPNEVESRTRVAYSKMETPKRRVAGLSQLKHFRVTWIRLT
jgi:hypothetical protein